MPQNTGASIFGVLLDGIRGRYADDESMGSGPGKKRVWNYSSPSVECAICAMGFMSVVPAHLMRSVGGGYDNESVAVTAMTLTFCLWMRSLRNQDKYSFLFGILAGVAYFYMVAAWGGKFLMGIFLFHTNPLKTLSRVKSPKWMAESMC